MALLDLESLKQSKGFRPYDAAGEAGGGIYTNDESHAAGYGFAQDASSPQGYKTVQYSDWFKPAASSTPPPTAPPTPNVGQPAPSTSYGGDNWANGQPPGSALSARDVWTPTPIPVGPPTAPTTPTTPPTTAPTDWSTVDANKIQQYYASRNTTPRPTSVDYWVSKWPELVARGKEIGNPNYAFERLQAAEEFGGSPTSPTGGGGGTGTGTPTATSAGFPGGTYEQALAFVQSYAQSVLKRSLTDAEVKGLLAKYGGGPGMNVAKGALDPVLADVAKMTKPNPPIVPGNTGVPGVNIKPDEVYPGNLFNDPGTQLLEDTIKARLNELFAATNDPALKQLYDMIGSRITDLQKPVYSDQDEAVIRSKVFDNMEHDRQNEIQSAIERLAGLGHGKESGSVIQAIDDVNRRYDTTRATSENDLALAAIDATQQRADQALQLAGTNYDLSQGVTDQETARRREALSLVSTLSDIPGQRLQLAEQAAGMSVNPASISDQILKLMTNSQTQADNAANRRSGLVTGIGQIVGSILAGQLNRKTA